MTDRDFRELERRYRRERAAILEDEPLSWEKKMRAVSELFVRYDKMGDELRRAADNRAAWAAFYRAQIRSAEAARERAADRLARLIDERAG